MSPLIKVCSLAAFLSLLMTLQPSLSWALSKGEVFSVNIENDTKRIGGPNSDSGYTNGIRFTYQFAQEKTPSWAPHFQTWTRKLYNSDNEATNFGLSLTHKMFTPQDTKSIEFQVDDRPYAAWLYLGFSMNTKTRSHSHSLEVDLGLIGPGALGKDVQNNFHRAIGIGSANGWQHQLKDEPTLQINYIQKTRFVDVLNPATGRMFDIIPFSGASFGNVNIGLNAGAIARLGYNLPNDFGPARASANDGEMVQDPTEKKSKHIRGYIFGSARGRLVGRDIFLDGNTFVSSHHVTKKPFVAETDLGWGIHYRHLSFIWRFVTISPEFEEKSAFQSFASISLNYFQDID